MNRELEEYGLTMLNIAKKVENCEGEEKVKKLRWLILFYEAFKLHCQDGYEEYFQDKWGHFIEPYVAELEKM
jgi:hypothetical protein